MKDFAKSIRTGNETAEERLGLKPVIEGVTKDIIEIYKKNGKNRELTKKELIERHHLTEKQAEEALRKIVGNTKSLNKAIVLKDGDVWVVLYANETKSKEFDTESEARKFAASVGNSKVGNSFDSVYNAIYAVKSYADNAEDLFNGSSPNLDAVKRNLQQTISAAQKAISELETYKREQK